MTEQVFAGSITGYFRAGWPAILPVPPETKFPPPVGFTGDGGTDTSAEQLTEWATNGLAGHSVALRMPDGVIGIDVDDYVKGDVVKAGARTLAGYVSQWGPLPDTWCSTARGDDTGPGPSGIRFFRVPPGRYATHLGADIEIIQRHHRYAVVAPSLHHAARGVYRWYRPQGSAAGAGEVPGPEQLAELPQRWVEGLRAGATEAGPAAAGRGEGEWMRAALEADVREPCSEVADALSQTDLKLTGVDEGGRHDAMTARVHRLVMLGAWGHPGLAFALGRLRGQWAEMTGGREVEFDGMVLTSARKAVTAVGPKPVDRDPCLMTSAGFAGPPAGELLYLPGDDADVEWLPQVEPYSWRHIIGTQPFDPVADTDQAIAAEVLARVWPMLRHASDTKNGWLLRGPTRWELHGDLTRRAVAEVAGLMPRGDPDLPEKKAHYTPENRQHVRRMRMHTNAAAGAVAAAMRAIVGGGWHPAAVKVAELDNEPEVLWAGGMPYDLRASRNGPTFARVELNTPHMVSAAVAPDVRPTPAWEAFLSAVWPDPAVRAWALRVLSITLTGHPDAALVILLGRTGSGKTSTVELLMNVLGAYAHAANPKLLNAQDNSHDSIVFDLKGRRLSFIDEGPREGRWAQERLKQLTGGASLTGNAMGQNPVTFAPTHTLVLSADTDPVLTDVAVRRRVRLIPCNGDPALVRVARASLTPAVWAREAPGVLAALMAEAAAWLADPDSALTSAAPESIRGWAGDLADEQDPIVRWLDEACEPYPAGSPARALFVGFVGWCKDGNIMAAKIPTETAWGRALTTAGYPATRTAAGRLRPLRIRPDDMFAWPTGPSPSVQTGRTVGAESENQPSTPQTPRSTPVFPSSFYSMYREEEEREEEGREGEVGGNTGIYESGADGGEADPALVTNGPPPAKTPKIDPTHRPSAAVVANLAKTAAITKAQARARLKAEAREAAIAAAAGEALSLPAVVDRNGTILPLTVDQATAIVRGAVERSAALTVDVETSGYPVGHADYALRSVQLGDATAAVVFHPVEHAEVIRTLLAEAPALHAHSATADLVPLAHAGLVDPESAWERMHDTVIPAKLADPASTGSDPGLKKLSAAVLGDRSVAPVADTGRAALFKAAGWLTDTKVSTPVERSGWAQVDTRSATMLRYAASDVLDTAVLAKVLPRPAPAVYERERLAQRMTARVTHHGIRLDAEHIAELTDRHTTARAEAAVRVRAFGVDNPGSDQQVGLAAAQLGATLPTTPSGRPSVAAGVLEPLRGAEGPLGDLVGAVLDYRHADTALGLFLEPYRLLCDRGDGRARPTIYTLGTSTGRMAAVRPNLQQLPREGGMRACLTADPGQLMIGADFSGVEIRVAAALSQDPTLMRMLADDRDLHAEIARLVWGPAATMAHRYKAKPMVFQRIYGGGVPGLARQAGVPLAVAQAVVDALDALTPQLSAWSAGLSDAVKRGLTTFETYAGRIIHLPVDRPHAAPNFAIQGTARELLVDALVRWNDTSWAERVLLPVHDELDVFVPEADADAATAELVRCMETELFGVRIQAKPSVPAFAWADSA